MSVQDPIAEVELTELTDQAIELDDDVEAHGAKEWIAGLSTAVVLGGAGASMAAASFSTELPDARQAAHAAVDTAFDTAATAVGVANETAADAQRRAASAADYAGRTAAATIDFAQSTAMAARDTALDRVDEAIDLAEGTVEDAKATVESLSAPIREIVREIVQNEGDVATETRVVSTLPRSFAGQAVTFSAVVTPGEVRVETVSGRVTFLDGRTRLGTVAVTAGGLATFTTDDLAAGERAIRAVFHGNELYNGSVSARADQDVVKATTATVVRSSTVRSAIGSSVRIIATVASAHPGAIPSTGDVSFWNGDVKLGVARIAADGTASIATSALGVGLHDIVAQYAGDSRHSASESLPLPMVVIDDPATTAGQLVVAVSELVPDSIDLSFTVDQTSGSASTKDGTKVVFRQGNTFLGTATLKDGRATITVAGAGISGTISVSTQDGLPLSNIQWLA